MTNSFPGRPWRLFVNLLVLLVAYLLVMANSAPSECESSRDFEGRFDVTTDCGIGSGELRTSRIRVVAEGSDAPGEGEWRTTVETVSGEEIVAKVVSTGNCLATDKAEVRAFRIYVTENASSYEVAYVCGSAVYGTLGTTCDEELACVDCEEVDNACDIMLEPVVTNP